jgi:hypothetical protein
MADLAFRAGFRAPARLFRFFMMACTSSLASLVGRTVLRGIDISL